MKIRQLWQWRGLTHEGEIRQGVRWDISRAAVLLALQQQHLTPIGLKRCAVRSSLWGSGHGCDVIRQLATLLHAGLTLPDGLHLLAQQQPAKQWQALLESLGQELEKGVAFSLALKQWPEAFPPLWLSMIRTGELTGQLEQCCFHLAEQQENQQRLAAKVRKALRYPIIILSLALAVIMAMVCWVLPEFAAIYQTFNTPLPALTRGVMAFAGFIQQWGWCLVGVTLLLIIVLNRLRHHTGWLMLRQKWLLKCPIAGSLIRGQKLSHIFSVLALTQRAGIAFLQGLQNAGETLECPYWQHVLRQAHQDITQGIPIWQALKSSGEFSPLCLQLIRTGEVSGALDTMLENLARHHSEKTQMVADNLATLLEPLLLIVTGAIIGTLVVAMYLPIFHLGDAMSGMG
ncbi:type IV pilin biogenesis protein [Superficieibacter electus]|uniref:Type IV pilin biogenesis protein n=1 Tax=Superficieibacter electus TaxID=2022662 RepID=A0A2P5GMB1_9ENTR|nr:protein transport protein HofC [Superficieibacter electus]POP42040.1 type IV pilin biogenesis protein [Superficieibacter electus]POP46959.1 type IV pilin biogenesis protein [Superficieibacter electus]